MNQSKYTSPILSLCLSLSVYANSTRALTSNTDIDDWLTTLRSSDEKTRLKNAYNIDGLVPFSRDAVLTLLRVLKDRDPVVRMYAASALGEASDQLDIIVPALIERLSDPSQEVREHATLALAKTGGPAVRSLVKALERMEEGFPPPDLFRTERKIAKQDITRRKAANRNDSKQTTSNNSHLERWDDRISVYAALALIQIGDAAVPEVSQELKSEKPNVRKYAEYILIEIGESVLPSLVPYLDNSDRTVRRAARSVLSRIHISAKSSVPILRQLLKSDDEELRIKATSALANVGIAALPELDVSLKDADPKVRLAAIEALQEISEEYDLSEVAARLLSATKDKSDEVKVEALKALREQKATALDAASLTALLKCPNVQVRVETVLALGDLAGHDPASVTALINALSDTDFDVRESATKSLGAIGAKARPAIPYLILAFKNSDSTEGPSFNGIILETLCYIGESSREVINLLTASLQDSMLRDNALRGFIALGETAAKDSVPAILDAIQARVDHPSDRTQMDEDAVREFIEALPKVSESGFSAFLRLLTTTKSEAIRRHGTFNLVYEVKSPDERVIPTLIILLSDKSSFVRSMAASALGKQSSISGSVVPALTNALNDPDAEVRKAALRSLKKIGKDALPAVPRVVEQLADPKIRGDAAQTLSAIDPTNTTGIRMLIKELNVPHSDDPNDRIYNSAVYDLKEIGQPAVLTIAQTLKDPDKIVRQNASAILNHIGSHALDALPALNKALKDSDSEVRLNAAQAIGNMKAEARSKETGQTLIELLTDTNKEVRLAAADALLNIGFELGDAVGTFSTIVNDDFISRLVSAAHYKLANTMVGYRRSTLGIDDFKLPPLPWPPPRFSDWFVLSNQFIGSDINTLGNVHEKIRQALFGLGYDAQGLFEVPGVGFAVVTRVERINEDGTSFSGLNRWTRDRIPPDSVGSYVRTLFFERPGRFRLFVFAITTLGNFKYDDRSLSETEARNLVNQGGRILPADLRQALFKGYFVHTLIYVFKKKAGQVATIEYEDPLGPETHLTKAGILNRL